MSSLLPTQPAATVSTSTAATDGRSGHDERRERDHRTNELLRAAARAAGSERDRLIDEVVVDNLGLADAVSRRYSSRGIDADELRQVARLGLVAAARRFDPDRGSDFVAFAVPTILGEIKRYFRDHTWSVRPPRRVQELRSAMTAASAELCQTLRSIPTAADLAAHLGASVDEILEAEWSSQYYAAMSIDQPADDAYGEGTALSDRLGAMDAGYDRAEAIAALASACRALPARDAHIIHLRFFCGWTQHEIGEEIGVTQMQVSRLIYRILRQLRNSIGEVDVG